MLRLWQFAILLALALVTAIVVLINMRQYSSNRELQFEVNQRAQFVQQAVPLENLSREIALSLAQLGLRSQDDQIRALLTSLGISVTVNQGATGASVSPAQAKGPTR